MIQPIHRKEATDWLTAWIGPECPIDAHEHLALKFAQIEQRIAEQLAAEACHRVLEAIERRMHCHCQNGCGT